MAPRRIFVAATVAKELAARLLTALDRLEPVALAPAALALLRDLVAEATLDGAAILLDGLNQSDKFPGCVGATLLTGVTPSMRAANADLFAPILSLLPFRSVAEAATMHDQCPYALTAAIFGPEQEARALARGITAGTVLLNDLIAPTADARVPFGGRKRSGFGVTRGRDGLLAMTAPRALVRQRSRGRIAYQPTQAAHTALFAGYLQAAHGLTLRERVAGLRTLAASLPGLRKNKTAPPQTE